MGFFSKKKDPRSPSFLVPGSSICAAPRQERPVFLHGMKGVGGEMVSHDFARRQITVRCLRCRAVGNCQSIFLLEDEMCGRFDCDCGNTVYETVHLGFRGL